MTLLIALRALSWHYNFSLKKGNALRCFFSFIVRGKLVMDHIFGRSNFIKSHHALKMPALAFQF
jgi:hypothetical protein